MTQKAHVSVASLWQQVRAPVPLYFGALAGAAGVTTAVLIGAGFRVNGGWPLLALALIAALSERDSLRIKLTHTLESSIWLLPNILAAVLFGPVAAMAVAVASLLTDVTRPYMKWAVYTCSRSLTAAATGLIAVAVNHVVDGRIAALVVATIASALVAETLDITFAAVTRRVRGNGRMFDVVRVLTPLALSGVPLYTPVLALLIVAYDQLSPWTLPLFLIPAAAAQRLYVLYQEQRALAKDLVAANERLESANLSFATALVATLDARDRYTAGHSAAVAVYARDIAQRMGLVAEQQQLAHVAGLVHDIGKIGLPSGLLEKAGALTLDERRQMEQHPEIGARILANVDDYAVIAHVVRHHHERFDGLGYPDGLHGDDIPLLSRIIAVADAYNAMTSDRPYRDAMPSRVARLRLAQAVESQFDTAVVAAFEAILAGAQEAYRVGSGEVFTVTRSQEFRLEAVA